jgi:trehalose-6-phosphate synthase
VKGIADSDIVGFQRSSDTAHFLACAKVLSQEGTSAPVAKTYPISIDYAAVAAASATRAVLDRATELRETWGNPSTVFLGADRLDYTKGIEERLEAYELLLSSGRLSPTESVFVQAGSPSRENVESYRALQRRIETIVERINANFRSDTGRPAVVYLASNLEREEMLSLFVAADVMVVSALRDGMNLVAKEYIACRNEETGVLVLSTQTGAADSLTEALLVNPTNIQTLADTMLIAAHLTPSEQRRKMRALRAEVKQHDVTWWSDSILSDLASARSSG